MLEMLAAARGWLVVGVVLCAVGCGGERAESVPGESVTDDAAVGAVIDAAERGHAEIVLEDFRVTDEHLFRIGRLAPGHSLEKLDLGARPQHISDEGVLALRDLKSLRMLRLGEAPISDRGLAVVAGMPDLRHVNVVGSQVTDDGLANLSGLAQLELLRIGGARITDAGMARLAKLKQLKQLIIVNSPLTDASVPHFQQMTHLQSLYVLGSDLSDDGQAAISATLRPHRVHLHLD